MRITRTILVGMLLVAPACKKNNDAPPATDKGSSAMAGSAAAGSAMAGSAVAAGSAMGSAAAGSAAAAGSGSAAPAAGSDSASGSGAGSGEIAFTHHAGNCPSTVLGSTTTAAVKGKDVVITIVATDKDAIAAIQKRADELLKDKAAQKAVGLVHDQKGTHGGAMGMCPVYVPEGAHAKAKHDKGGVTVTIVPKGKASDLLADVELRITKSADWVKANIKPADKGDQGGVGGGKGEHGSNHSGHGDSKGQDRKDGAGGGMGTGGGGGKGTGGGSAKGNLGDRK